MSPIDCHIRLTSVLDAHLFKSYMIGLSKKIFT